MRVAFVIQPMMPPSAFSNAVVETECVGSETDDFIADDCNSGVTLGLVDLGEVAEEVAWKEVSMEDLLKDSNRGYTWRIVHASDKVARADRGTRVTFS